MIMIIIMMTMIYLRWNNNIINVLIIGFLFSRQQYYNWAIYEHFTSYSKQENGDDFDYREAATQLFSVLMDHYSRLLFLFDFIMLYKMIDVMLVKQCISSWPIFIWTIVLNLAIFYPNTLTEKKKVRTLDKLLDTYMYL